MPFNQSETFVFRVPFIDETARGQMEAMYPGIWSTFDIEIIDTATTAEQVAKRWFIQKGNEHIYGSISYASAERKDNFWDVTIISR